MSSKKTRFFIVSEIGSREEMEDRHVLITEKEEIFGGVYDGHWNVEAAEHAKNNLHKTFFEMTKKISNPLEAFQFTYKLIDDEMTMSSGTCAASFYIKNKVVYCANVGDSEIVIIGSDYKVLTKIDRVGIQRERERIMNSEEGQVRGGYMIRPTGEGLAVSRALGDHVFRKSGLIAIPHLGEYEILPTDKYLVAGTDGLFDLATYEDVLDWTMKHDSPRKMGNVIKKEIIDSIGSRRSTDNFTVVIVDLHSLR